MSEIRVVAGDEFEEDVFGVGVSGEVAEGIKRRKRVEGDGREGGGDGGDVGRVGGGVVLEGEGGGYDGYVEGRAVGH